MPSMTRCEATVCVTPTRLNAPTPARSRSLAKEPRSGPEKNNAPTCASRSSRSAGIHFGLAAGLICRTTLENTSADARFGV